MADYYLHRNGQNHGPYTKEDLKQFLADGQVGPEEMVCEEGGSQWVAAATLAKPSAPKLVVPAVRQPSAQSRMPATASSAVRRSAITPEMVEAADGKARFALKGIVISIAVPVLLFAAKADKESGVRSTGKYSGLGRIAKEHVDLLPYAIVLGIVGIVFFWMRYSKARAAAKEMKSAFLSQQSQ